MRVSSEGINLIKKHELLRLNKYICIAGHPTIGWGHRLLQDEIYTKIDISGAEVLLKQDLTLVENCINKLVTQTLTNNQFDALASLIFNIGRRAFANSTLLKIINKTPSDYDSIQKEFLKWIYVTKNGKKCKSSVLMVRRRGEADLYCKSAN